MSGNGLAGQAALITGAAKRLGRAVALKLAHEGANIVVHYNTSGETAEELAGTLRQSGVNAWTVQADLGAPDEARGLFERAEELAGPISLLVNNASIFPADALRDITEDSIVENLRVNALAPFLLCKQMADRKRAGSIVNFLDTRIEDYDAQHVSYHLSKRMLFTLTRMMALEFAPGLRVNGVAPGLVLPPPGKDESYLEALASTNPLRRHGAPEDVADAAAFLLKNAFITGQVVYVDGGRHMLGGVYG